MCNLKCGEHHQPIWQLGNDRNAGPLSAGTSAYHQMAAMNSRPSLLTNLASKTVIITGGCGGIGAATVALFHSHGANVVIADLPHTESTARALISSLSPRVVFIPSDIRNWASMCNLFRQARALFGPIEIVVANAGIMESTEFFKEEFDESGELKEPRAAYQVLDVNLKGTMNSKIYNSRLLQLCSR